MTTESDKILDAETALGHIDRAPSASSLLSSKFSRQRRQMASSRIPALHKLARLRWKNPRCRDNIRDEYTLAKRQSRREKGSQYSNGPS